MIKKYITKIIYQVLDKRELENKCVSNLCEPPVEVFGNNYYFEQRLERLQLDIEGLTRHLGLQKVYGSAFEKLNNKGAKILR